MKISLAINFPLCYLEIFDYFSQHTTNFSTYISHYTRYARVKNYVKKVSKFVLCKKNVKNLLTTFGKVN